MNLYDALLQRLPQPCKPMPSALGACIEAEDTVVGQRHLARHGDLAPADQPHSGHVLVGARHGRVVTTAVRDPQRWGAPWNPAIIRDRYRGHSSRAMQ